MRQLQYLQARFLLFFRRPGSAYALLLLLTALMFGDVLLTGGAHVLGNRNTDIFAQFLAWRQFGFGELAQGHLALWNPHVFGGAPYFGGFQSALLYPPNWIFLVLPVSVAINWSIALHVFLMGAFMNAWAVRRGLHPAGACLSGVLMMFSGAYFLHIYAGHLTNLSAMVWAPLVFLAIDGIFDACEKHANPVMEITGWCLLGSMAVNLQVLAGHPQYVFYTAVAVAMYCALRLGGARKKGAALLGLAGISVGGVVLAAVQLLAGLVAASETVRSKALSFDFASMFSLAPENLLTLIAPGMFGSLSPDMYFGRAYLWEMSMFMGVTACMLAAYGAIRGSVCITARQRRQLFVMVVLLVALALGVHTPLFGFLYSFVPGFASFRGTSKFIFPASLFIAMLAGIGFDRLLTTRQAEKGLVWGVFLTAGTLLVMASVVWWMDWLPVLQFMKNTSEAYLVAKILGDAQYLPQLPAFAAFAQVTAAKSLAVAGGVALLLGALLFWMRRESRVVWLIGLLALAEVFSFAAASRETGDIADLVGKDIKSFLDANPGDYRIANLINPNSALAGGAQDIGGNDPGVVRRYAELMAFLQGGDPNKASQYFDFSRPSGLLAMLRLRYVFQQIGNQIEMNELPYPMPRAVLVGNYRIIEGRDAIFAAIRDRSFDFRKEVILETMPDPLPSQNPEGTVRVFKRSSDSLIIEVETARPAILLMTDVYTPSWRATPLAGSAQSRYELLPANYALRAVPLTAGHHRISVEYRPRGLALGAWISILSLVIWLGVARWLAVRKPGAHRQAELPAVGGN